MTNALLIWGELVRQSSHRGFARSTAAAALIGAALLSPVYAAPTKASKPIEDPLPGDYRVVKGFVDRGTYSGWRIFHTSCHGCHGVGGTGTDLAPDLTQRVKEYTPRGFASKVLTSYRIVSLPGPNGDDPAAERERLLEDVLRRERTSRGQVVMPAWEGDNAVPAHVLDLYAYLSARGDGALGPGKPRVRKTR